MSGRTKVVLSRFPAHMEAGREGKQFSTVVDAIATEMDSQSAIMARIRRAHRLADADEERDILHIAAVHGIEPAELVLLVNRFNRAQALLAQLASAADAQHRDSAAEQLIGLWGIAAATPRLPLYAPPHDAASAPDLDAAKNRLLKHAGQALRNDAFMGASKARVGKICAIHAHGNGTIRALLLALSNALDLDATGIFHASDRYWHAATVRDRLTLLRPVPAPPPAPGALPGEVDRQFPPAGEVLGIEENPLWRAVSDVTPRKHAELFSLLRRGFERALLQVRVSGIGNRTIAPMVVNRDEGHGVAYTRPVPDGQTLVFTEEGRVLADGADVTALSFAWTGACFADGDVKNSDKVFDGPEADPAQKATFAQTTPPGAFEPDASFPHAGDSLPMPGIAVGETRFAFFVQEGFYSFERETGTPRVVRVSPRPAVAFLDNSVFAAPAESRQPAAKVSLSWLEHRAFSVRALIPPRFLALTPDDPEGVSTRQRVAQAVDRFRPAGVELKVEFSDDRWVLGQGELLAASTDDPIARLKSGTSLWVTPGGGS